MLQWAAKGAAVCVLQIQTRSAAFGNAHDEGAQALDWDAMWLSAMWKVPEAPIVFLPARSPVLPCLSCS